MGKLVCPCLRAAHWYVGGGSACGGGGPDDWVVYVPHTDTCRALVVTGVDQLPPEFVLVM